MRQKSKPVKSGKKKIKQYDIGNLLEAYQKVVEDGLSVRGAAKKFSVPVTTLRDRVNGKIDHECVTMGVPPIFSMEQEAMMVKHLRDMATLGYGYSRQEVLDVATEWALSEGLRETGKRLSLRWFQGFVKRWPEIKVIRAKSLGLARAKSANKEAIESYFNELHTTLQKYNFQEKPHRIFNLDEKGITINQKPPRVVAAANCPPQAVTSGRSTTTTVLGCGNAVGFALPPYFVFKGKRFSSDLIHDCTPGASGTISDSGCSNTQIFLKYLQEHFVKFVPGGLQEPVLLILDGHRSHTNLVVVQWAKDNNIIILTLPAHTSHLLQPLDVSCYGPMEEIYNNLCHVLIKETKAGISRYDVSSLGSKAYIKALSTENLISGFRKCGIFPFDSTVVPAEKIAPSTVSMASSTVTTEVS